MDRTKIKKLCALMIFLSFILAAQIKSNNLYFEAFGNGGLYSLNYERLFNEKLGGRIGFMYLPSMDFIIYSVGDLIVFPLMVNYLAGENSKLELGAGIIFVSIGNVSFLGLKGSGGSSAFAGTAVIGYRYQPKEGGFLFRIGLTPFLRGDRAALSGGVSIGVNF